MIGFQFENSGTMTKNIVLKKQVEELDDRISNVKG